LIQEKHVDRELPEEEGETQEQDDFWNIMFWTEDEDDEDDEDWPWAV